MNERAASRRHLTVGFAIGAPGVLAWLFGWNGYVSAAAVLVCNVYLVSILVEASLRAQQERKIVDGVPQPKPSRLFEFPEPTWTLLQVQFLLAAVVFGFANMYIRSGGVRYQEPAAAIEQSERTFARSPPPTDQSARLVDRIDALYYSVVTLSTVGYGDFAPTTRAARLLVLWQIGTGMLLLLGVFPLIVGRISDF
jgi:Ion channel